MKSLLSTAFKWEQRKKWKNPHKYGLFHTLQRARDGTRTRGPDLGKVVLHQLSHSRIYSSVPDGQIILYMIFFTLSTNLFEFFTTVYFLLFYPVPALYSENSFKRFVNALFCQRAILNRLQYTVISSFKILRHQDHIGPRL